VDKPSRGSLNESFGLRFRWNRDQGRISCWWQQERRIHGRAVLV